MADKTLTKVLPPIKAYDNGDTPTTHSIAVKDFNSDAMLAAVQTMVASGLARQGVVTDVPNVTTFRVAGFVGLGSTFFRGWSIFVLWKTGGLGAAPQGERQVASAFNSADGTFTHPAFSVTLAVGDKVLLIHPWLASTADWLNGERLDLLIDTIVTNVAPTVAGRTQSWTRNVTLDNNAGASLLATVTTQACKIKSIVARANAAQTANLISIAITGGAANALTFIDAVLGLRVNIAAEDQQVSWEGRATLAATKTLTITLTGGAAANVNLQVDVEYEAVVSGGYLV